VQLHVDTFALKARSVELLPSAAGYASGIGYFNGNGAARRPLPEVFAEREASAVWSTSS